MNTESDMADEQRVTDSSADPDVTDAAGAPGAGDPNYTPPSVSRKPLGCLIEIAETLILTIVIFWVIQTFVAQPFQVQQESMHSTLEEGQYVLVDKISPKFDSYSRGDIVVFNPVTHDGACSEPSTDIPGEQDTPFIKRVIGEPGDSVSLQNGNVIVNGVKLSEPYVHGATTNPLSSESSWTVPADRIFVMGDNRLNSTDSRAFGPVCIGEVIGRAWLRYWPINTLGILQTPTYPGVPPATTAAH